MNQKFFSMLQQTSNDDVIVAVTGDIDNLGLFVSENGRAKAECLVDNYNALISSEVQFLCQKYNIKYEISLSGEEIFAIFSLPKEILLEVIESFFRKKINSIISQKSPFFRPMVTISFGILELNKIFDKELNYIRCGKYDDSFMSDLIYRIRIELALYLDYEKFNDLNLESREEFIFMRNLVYAKMKEYKKDTALLLKKISKDDMFKEYAKKYGLTYGNNEEEYSQLMEIIESLSK